MSRHHETIESDVLDCLHAGDSIPAQMRERLLRQARLRDFPTSDVPSTRQIGAALGRMRKKGQVQLVNGCTWQLVR